MSKLSAMFKSRKFGMRLHLGLMGLWIVLIVPTLLWWKDSILWVLIISIYANIASHLGAYEAVRSTPKEKN